LIEKKQLEYLIKQGYSIHKISKELNVSKGCVRYHLTKHGLTTKKPKQPLQCKLCGETDATKFYHHKDGRIRYRCKACDSKENTERFRRYKKEAVEYKGGKCERCGYDKCYAAFDFHHKDPLQKDPNWPNMGNWPLKSIKHELDKCMLVCATCHREIHYYIEGN
jgi:hypothetical protein